MELTILGLAQVHVRCNRINSPSGFRSYVKLRTSVAGGLWSRESGASDRRLSHSSCCVRTILALRLDHGAQEALHCSGSRPGASEELSSELTPVAGQLTRQCQHGQSANSPVLGLELIFHCLRLPRMSSLNYNTSLYPGRPMEPRHSDHVSSDGRACRASAGLRRSSAAKVLAAVTLENRKSTPWSWIPRLDGLLASLRGRRYSLAVIHRSPFGLLTLCRSGYSYTLTRLSHIPLILSH